MYDKLKELEGTIVREQPLHEIAQDAVKVWRIHAAIYVIIFWMFIIAWGIITFIFSFPYLYTFITVVLGLMAIYVFIILIPTLRYKRWRYEIFEQEIYIQHGILIVKRTLIPMIRVQHVDTEQGPILKKYDLATVSISTAATTHYIPALNGADAEDLRDKISTLARVDDYDV